MTPSGGAEHLGRPDVKVAGGGGDERQVGQGSAQGPGERVAGVVGGGPQLLAGGGVRDRGEVGARRLVAKARGRDDLFRRGRGGGGVGGVCCRSCSRSGGDGDLSAVPQRRHRRRRGGDVGGRHDVGFRLRKGRELWKGFEGEEARSEREKGGRSRGQRRGASERKRGKRIGD